MTKTVTDDVLELMKPAINQRILELVNEVFKLAQFAGSIDYLEKAIDECTSKYFGDTSHDITLIDSPLEEVSDQLTADPARVGKNIVARPLCMPQQPVQVFKKIRNRSQNGIDLSRSPGTKVRAEQYSNVGTPISKYIGVSYSGSINKPWVVRYRNKRVGTFANELQAAKLYDACLKRSGKQPVNFTN
jgi:hypothetical protein